MDWKAWSELALNILTTASSLGLLAALGFSIRWYWNRMRWRNFARRVDRWASYAVGEPTDDALRLMTVNWLTDSGFSPVEASTLLEHAMLFARARIDFANYPDYYRKEGP